MTKLFFVLAALVSFSAFATADTSPKEQLKKDVDQLKTDKAAGDKDAVKADVEAIQKDKDALKAEKENSK